VPSGSGERPTVGPKTGGGWQVSGDLQTNKTQREGELAARKLANGGGELVVKGRDGRLRMQNTIGRSDPRRRRDGDSRRDEGGGRRVARRPARRRASGEPCFVFR
jgi:uncharacterized protein DUF2188